jgi:alkaline phosphatase
MLEMDRMDYRGMVTTSGADSISTDSANSMSAYTCGQKSAVNAMGRTSWTRHASPSSSRT